MIEVTQVANLFAQARDLQSFFFSAIVSLRNESYRALNRLPVERTLLPLATAT
jgi:hypothetical protein